MPGVIVDGLDVAEVQRALYDVGLGVTVGDVDGVFGPRTEMAVERFQEAYFEDGWEVDGVVGEKTWVALGTCVAEEGHITEHFRLSEFADPGTGEVRLRHALVAGLERLRAVDQQPLPVVSGFRSFATNVRVGGAAMSAHLYGLAADIPARFPADTALALQCFSGVGWDGSTGLVLHVDVRHVHLSPEAVGGGTLAEPDTWTY